MFRSGRTKGSAGEQTIQNIYVYIYSQNACWGVFFSFSFSSLVRKGGKERRQRIFFLHREKGGFFLSFFLIKK